MSRETLRVNQGSLYPALYRLEDRGWISPEWGIVVGASLGKTVGDSVGRPELGRDGVYTPSVTATPQMA
jgi:hypothetical protein